MTAADQTIPGVEALTSTTDVRLVPAAEWDALVARLGGDDTYLRLGYHHASVHLEAAPAHPVLLHLADASLGGELALPLLLRPLPDGSGWDATSAYGYGGPVATGPIDAARFADVLDTWARANDVACTFLRLHPLLANQSLLPSSAIDIELGATVAWDVSADRGELLPLMHTHHRRAVRKADRAELELRVTAGPSDLAGFRKLYDETMRRQDATDFYFFGDAYWTALVEDCAEELVLVEGLLAGEVVAALLCFARGPWLHYHLGASADAARNIGASNRCFLAAAEWAQSRGMTRFHLGGGVGAGTDSALFQFKHRYDPLSEPQPFHIAKIVHDADRFRALAGTDSLDGYFPPWRAPA
ncbi:MAG: putative GCN5-related N-acetyltransferase [Thermoleophilia bacterium]|nr:putative GCN5-related N-acetyltransferase [Thermoleophilia bacterium]